MSRWDEERDLLEAAPLNAGQTRKAGIREGGPRPSGSTTPRRASRWLSDGTKAYTDEERAAIDTAADLLDRVHVPGRDPEPQWTAELVDRSGTVWRKTTEGANGRSHGTACWTPDEEPELGLKWSSPAMAAAGPFMGPARRTEQEVREAKARAARVRWDAHSQNRKTA